MEIGEIFGSLTVVDFSSRKIRGFIRKVAVCKCVCGSEYVAVPDTLTSGRVKSCGCRQTARGKKLLDITGQVYGRLTVVSFESYVTEGRRGSIRARWNCSCTCGNDIKVTSNSLRRGNTRSCGCLLEETNRTANAFSVVNRMRDRAIRDGKDWTLTDDEAVSLITGDCTYCGRPPRVSGTTHKYIPRNGIDRINSNKGYESGNVSSCCPRCNIAKNDQTLNEFQQQIWDQFHTMFKPKKVEI